MNKQRLLVIVNLTLGILILSQFATIVLMNTIGYKFFEAVHEVNGFIILVLIILHVILNWPWIKKNVFKLRSTT